MCRSCAPVRKFVAEESQQDDDAIAQAEREARQRELEMAASILNAIMWLRPRVVAVTQYVLIPQVWDGFGQRLAAALVPGFAIHDLAANAVVAGRGTFDPLDVATIDRQAAYRAQFISEFGAETRKAVDMAYAWGVKKGLDSEAIQKILTAIAGLNGRQTGAVLNQWVSRQESGASPKLLDRMLEAAAKKLAKERARTTADSEGWRLFQLGQWSAMDQQERDGAAVTKEWIVTPDERLCPTCSVIPGMNAKGVPMGEAFRTPIGPRMMPPLHPRCRCKTLYTINRGGF